MCGTGLAGCRDFVARRVAGLRPCRARLNGRMPAATRSLYLIRHGQSRTQTGEADPGEVDPDLSRLGRRQAVRLRGALAGVVPDLVVCSTMRRAWQTLELSRISAPRMRFDSRLIESDWGLPRPYAGLRGADLPGWAEADRHRAEVRPVATRVRSLLRDLVAERAGTVVLVGHWGVFAHLFQAFFRLPAAGSELNASDNASVSLLEIGAEGRRRLRYWNERAHLGRLHAQPFW